ncbi:MAG: glycosyltransferase family 4 protein [Thermodesulfovibrio sp.]|nr:glycosyltransferase family 4 protein [Thermodesulfovibrio sp.]
MRILILNTRVPFVRGGAESLERGLIKALTEAGHNVDIIRILENWSSHQYLLKMMLEARIIEIENLPLKAEMVITLKFPSYFVKHSNKIVWFLHHYRQFYDLWDSPFSIPHTDETKAFREIVMQADTEMLKEAKRVFAISRTVADRLGKYNGIKSKVVYPPLENKEGFRCDGYEDFLFFPSRLSPIKRHELAIEAMSHVKSPLNLIIAGGVEDQNYLNRIEALISKLGLNDRVKILKNLSREQIIELYSKCLAVIFPSYQEDYGYITLEAMYSSKAVITCTDSGGPTEFVKDGFNGLIISPDANYLADALERIYNDKTKAKEMGKAGYEKILSLDISWQRVIEEFTNE